VSERWQRYYAAAGDAPRETLLDALARFEADAQPAGLAVDLGCGTGRDTLELLRRGWRVVAIDAEPAAIELLLDRPEAAGHHDRLETVVARLGEAEWPEAELVNASFSLPFCPPAEFEGTWQRVVDSLVHGGRFCGQLFGDHDGWAPADSLTFHSRAQVEELLAGLDVERLDELEQDGQTAVGDPKHWHLFHLVARRP
jgi:tellurite methyltransferase